MKDLIKEVAPFLIMKFWKRDQWNNEYFDGIGYSEALVAELSKRAEAVGYLRVTEKVLVFMPLVPVEDGARFFTFQPIHDIEAIENRVAVACAEYISNQNLPDTYSEPCLEAFAKDIRSGEWRKYK